jgi:hypothetical protein
MVLSGKITPHHSSVGGFAYRLKRFLGHSVKEGDPSYEIIIVNEMRYCS